MITIDVMGKPCPIPVIEAKKALSEQGSDGALLKVDNLAAVQNLEKMANGLGYAFSYREHSENHYEVTLTKAPSSPETEDHTSKNVSCAVPSGGRAVVISRNTMGEGSEELGKILIKAFIHSLSELSIPPEYIFFLNSGAYLTAEGSNTIDDLNGLESKGTAILTCGTCIDYYKLTGKLAVGSITNMYEIAEKMLSASGVINI